MYGHIYMVRDFFEKYLYMDRGFVRDFHYTAVRAYIYGLGNFEKVGRCTGICMHIYARTPLYRE